MPAIRRSRSVYVDPWTLMEIDPGEPQPLPIIPAAPVYRRKATPEELARLEVNEPARLVDSSGLVPRPIRGHLTDAEKRERARLRGGEANRARVKAEPKPPKPPRERKPRGRARHAQKVTDAAVIEALYAAKGNRVKAAAIAGLSAVALSQRVGVLLKYGVMPEDLAAIIAARKRGMP